MVDAKIFSPSFAYKIVLFQFYKLVPLTCFRQWCRGQWGGTHYIYHCLKDATVFCSNYLILFSLTPWIYNLKFLKGISVHQRSLVLITRLKISQNLVNVYVSLAALSEGPKSIHTSFSVRPCALWMVIDHASLRGYCCLSNFSLRASEQFVTWYNPLRNGFWNS